MQFEQKTCWLGHTTGSLTYEYHTTINFSSNPAISASRVWFNTQDIHAKATLSTRLTFPRQIWQEIGRVMDREVEETETFLFAIRLFTLECHAIWSIACAMYIRDIEVTSEAHETYSGYSRVACAVGDLIQHGGNFESGWDGRVVEQPCCFLRDPEISPDSGVVPF